MPGSLFFCYTESTEERSSQPLLKMKAPDFTDYRFTGKEGKAYVVTNGISTRYLTGKEFRQFSRQLFNL